MKISLLLISILWFSLVDASAHPVHVSVCNIEIKDQKALIFIKLFKDDFLLAIEHNFGKLLDLDEIDDPKNMDLVDLYLSSMFNISMNKNDTLRLNHLRSELNEEALWFYFESELPELKKIRIDNTIFLDIYDDQTNLVIINFNGKQNGYRFNFQNYSEEIDLRK